MAFDRLAGLLRALQRSPDEHAEPTALGMVLHAV